MNDGIDAIERVINRLRVTDIALLQFNAGRRLPAAIRAMHIGPERIDDANLVAPFQEPVNDVMADEAGAAGHEDTQRLTPWKSSCYEGFNENTP
jgi:hypothetical protein